MAQNLDALYQCFYQKQEYPNLKLSVEENHKLLIARLQEDDRKTVLRIIDALDMISTIQTKDSFIQGVRFALDLENELKNYDDHNLRENVLDDCGHFFMTGGKDSRRDDR